MYCIEIVEILHVLKCVLFCACIQYIHTCKLPSSFSSKSTTYEALASSELHSDKMCIEVCVQGANISTKLRNKKKKSMLTWKTRGSFRCIVDFKSACFFCFVLMLLGPKLQCNFYLTWLLRSPLLARAPYIMLFDLKPLKECVFEWGQSTIWGPPCCSPRNQQHWLGQCYARMNVR